MENLPLDFDYGKTCYDCKEFKDFSQFTVNRSSKDGHSYLCIPCTAARPKRKRIRTDEWRKEYQKEWVRKDSEKNREKYNEKRRKYYVKEVANWTEEKTEKLRLYHEKYRAKNKELIKLRRYLSTYGITTQQYEDMVVAQNGVCAICKKSESQMLNNKKKRLAVDHCHDTGEVRGLLCGACNSAIGLMGEDPSVFMSAIEYLRKHK